MYGEISTHQPLVVSNGDAASSQAELQALVASSRQDSTCQETSSSADVNGLQSRAHSSAAAYYGPQRCWRYAPEQVFKGEKCHPHQVRKAHIGSAIRDH